MTVSAPLVYVIVLSWNGLKHTLACLASLEAVHYSRYRVCLVDNASTDGTVTAVSAAFPHVTVIANARNLGFAAGSNLGLRQALAAGASYALLVNNDATLAPDALQHLVDTAEADPAAALVGPMIYYADRSDVIWSAGGEISLWRGRIAHRGLRQRDAGQFTRTVRVDYATACVLLVRCAALARIGLLDEGYFAYGEDADWCLRAARAGYGTLFVPRARAWHAVSAASSGPRLALKAWRRLTATLRFLRRQARWPHWLTIPLLLPVTLVLDGVRFIASQIERGAPAGKG
jgi:GT2 family glycosyltransferase